MLKEKYSRHGSKKLANKLNVVYECSLKTMDELAIDDDFSSAPAQECCDDNFKRNECNKRSSKKLVSNNTATKHNLNAHGASDNVKLEENNCSKNIKNNNKIKSVNSGSSCFKRLIFRDSNLLINGDDMKQLDKKVEVRIEEPVRTQAILFHVEEKSQCKQVLL